MATLSTTESPGAEVAAAAGPAPLWATLAFTFIASMGTGIVTVGLFFIAHNAYGFGTAEKFLLGLGEGLGYIAGAVGAGPAIRRLRARWPGLTSGGVLVGISFLLGALCLIPIVTGTPADPASASHWPVWALMLVYSPITGALWPVVETYVSGGRTGVRLRSALGRFNITWSIAVVVGLVLIGPAKLYPAELIASLFGLHALCAVLVRWMGPEPGRHLHEHHEPHPAVYTQLLTTFRILLPVTYIVLMAFNPYLPTLLKHVGIGHGWQAPLAATWTAARVVTFIVLERWHGWQGRWWPTVLGIGALLGGFAVALLAPMTGAGPLAQSIVLAGLFAFGCGMAMIYTGAIYYALEVGNAAVDAGGRHEALIGVGYTVGPVCGLASLGIVEAGVLPSGRVSFEMVMLALVGVIALAAAGVAGRCSWNMARRGSEPGRKEPRPTS